MADVDPKLQSNRVKDLGGTVRPSRKIELAIIVAVSLILTTFALVCSHAGHPFQIFALMYLVSGQWSLTAGQWALAVAVLVVLAVACGVGAWLIASKAVPWATGAKARTRVDVYAPAMGHGEAVEKVTRQRAEAMASRLIEADRYRKGMSPGYPLGLNIVDNTSMYTPAGRTWLSFWRAHVPANPCATRSRPCSRHRARAWRPRTRAISST